MATAPKAQDANRAGNQVVSDTFQYQSRMKSSSLGGNRHEFVPPHPRQLEFSVCS